MLQGPVIRPGDIGEQIFSTPPTLLSFDDGGVSAYEHIAPMLESYNWVGCFFITTDRIDTPAFVSREQIRDLHRRGHVIGSHSCSHPKKMSECSREELLEEWQRSLSCLVGDSWRKSYSGISSWWILFKTDCRDCSQVRG